MAVPSAIRVPRLANSFALMLLLTGCSSSQVWVTSNLTRDVRIVSDSSDVGRLISTQERNDAPELRRLHGSQQGDERVRGVNDRKSHPERYAPTMRLFLDAMAARPSFSVPRGTTCRVLETSQARCTPGPLDTLVYVKVRITGVPSAEKKAGRARGSTYFQPRRDFLSA
jgi:hypothetical protein